jgi:hypothetical protein
LGKFEYLFKKCEQFLKLPDFLKKLQNLKILNIFKNIYFFLETKQFKKHNLGKFLKLCEHFPRNSEHFSKNKNERKF